VISPYESAIGPRFKHSRISMMEPFESSATKKMHLILRFPSSIVTNIADPITPTLVRLPTRFALKPQITAEKVAKHFNMLSRMSKRRKSVLVA
jgi:hypothetical protein